MDAYVLGVATPMDNLSTSQLFADPLYQDGQLVTIANIPLVYRSSPNGEGRIRRVGLRWFCAVRDATTPWIARLVMDNCGLLHEFPVYNICVPPGYPMPRTVAEANDYLDDVRSRRGNAVGEIFGDALLIHFQIPRLGCSVTLDVRRGDGDARSWADILEQTPSCYEYAPSSTGVKNRMLMMARPNGRGGI